jgi:carbamoyl-phosphate synthase large subunit
MRVVRSERELLAYLGEVARRPGLRSIVVSKFIEGAKEVEVDCVSDGERVLIGAVIEHLEPAGVHSGDATMVIPPFSLSESELGRIRSYTLAICRALGARGPVNVQYLVKGGEVYVIECNLRASRSMPFVSKVKGVNLMEHAARVILGGKLELPSDAYEPPPARWGVKTPQFSWSRLRGAHPVLGVEMRSTGEVAAVGRSLYDALLKSWLAAPPNRIPRPGSLVILSSDGGDHRELLLGLAGELRELGYEVLALGPEAGDGKLLDEVVPRMVRGEVGLVISLGDGGYRLRRACADYLVPLVMDAALAQHLVRAIRLLASGMELTVEPL